MPALRPRYDRVVILCPIVVTGGAEAIHQLADSLGAAGATVGVAYYGPGADLTVGADRVRSVCAADPKPRAYARYRTTTFADAPLTNDSLVLAPEAIVHRRIAHRGFHRALWWLSVDNAKTVAPFLDYERARLSFFRDDGFLHFYQSDYARDFLARSQAARIAPLSDYTNPEFLVRPANLDTKRAGARPVVSFFPKKGADLARAFFERHRDLTSLPIQGMDQAGVRRALQDSSVYIDFGHHPGKDRVPREAAMSGNVIFLHERGAAQFHLDHPLDPVFLFTSDDVRRGALHARVRSALADWPRHFAAQAPYRAQIAAEKDAFDLQIRTAFFDLDW